MTMRRRLLVVFTLCLAAIMTIVLTAALAAVANSEIEPNNDPAHATLLTTIPMTGAISPTTDVDWYALPGVNSTWGFIALLDTISSTGKVSGTLTAFGNDGTTLLQSDTNSWERGSGIALQSYVDNALTHFLKIETAISGTLIDTYTLRYYKTVVATQPEVEPNDTRSTGTPSGFTMQGIISPSSDVDCFSFQGRLGETIVIALDGDPEKDGSPIDPQLQLIGPSDTVLKTANGSGSGGKEFIRYTNLPTAGVYAYCVSAASGTGGPTSTYRVGLVREFNGLYFPDYAFDQVWLNPRSSPAPHARLGDLMTFRLSITDTSPLTIPGNIRQKALYSPACLRYVSAVPAPVTTSTNEISWNGLKPNGLGPGEGYVVTVTFQAIGSCHDSIFHDVGLNYYFTGTGNSVNYVIWGNVYLPLVLRSD